MSDPSCRIVIVASTLEKGALLVDKISSLTKKQSNQGSGDAPSDTLDITADSKEPLYHPWSISNRYYTADVHFALHTVSQVYGAVFSGAPAVIVAWTKGEPYEEYAERVQKALEDHEPEVLMAVRLPDGLTSSQVLSDGDADEDYSVLDSTLIGYGFEFIDASQSQSMSKGDEGEDVPRLPRVIDALSTIMWPSMSTTTPPSQDFSSLPHERQGTLEEIINRDPMAILQALEELDSEFNFGVGGEDLDDEAALYKDILQSASSTLSSTPLSDRETLSSEPLGMGNPVFNLNLDNLRLEPPPSFDDLKTPTFIDSPTYERSNSTDEAFGMFKSASDNPTPSLGFEDDFSLYVSPPYTLDDDDVKVVDDDFSRLHLDSPSLSGRSTPDYQMLHSSAEPHFPHNTSLYRSLGSTSDLGQHSEH